MRIGVQRANHLGPDDDPAVAPAFEAAVDVLRSLGASIVDVTIPHYAETVTAMLITCTAALAYHRQDMRERPQDYSAATRSMLRVGAVFSGADYVQAQRVRRVAQRGLAGVLSEVDVIVAPGASRAGPTYDELGAGGTMEVPRGVHTPYWDAVGNPAMVVPMGFTDERMPLSLQLGGRPFDEALLVRICDALQQATDWHLRVPPLVAGIAA